MPAGEFAVVQRHDVAVLVNAHFDGKCPCRCCPSFLLRIYHSPIAEFDDRLWRAFIKDKIVLLPQGSELLLPCA